VARNKSEKLTDDQVKLVAFAHLQERYEQGLAGEGERYAVWIRTVDAYESDDALLKDVCDAGLLSYDSIAKCILKRYGHPCPETVVKT